MAERNARPKFYSDKHIPKAVAKQLRSRGVDIVRCEDVGLGDADDLTHLEYATREGCAVITNDTDFIRLHYDSSRHCRSAGSGGGRARPPGHAAI